MASNESMAQWLIEHGANVNSQNSSGYTALHIAVMEIRPKFTKTFVDTERRAVQLSLIWLLIQYGANIDLLDRNDRSPLYYAVDGDDEETVHLLLQHGAAVEPPNGNWQKSMLLAVETGRMNILKLFLGQGALETTTTDQLSQLLVSAVRSKQSAMVKLLLRYGADVNTMTDKMWQS